MKGCSGNGVIAVAGAPTYSGCSCRGALAQQPQQPAPTSPASLPSTSVRASVQRRSSPWADATSASQRPDKAGGGVGKGARGLGVVQCDLCQDMNCEAVHCVECYLCSSHSPERTQAAGVGHHRGELGGGVVVRQRRDLSLRERREWRRREVHACREHLLLPLSTAEAHHASAAKPIIAAHLLDHRRRRRTVQPDAERLQEAAHLLAAAHPAQPAREGVDGGGARRLEAGQYISAAARSEGRRELDSTSGVATTSSHQVGPRLACRPL